MPAVHRQAKWSTAWQRTSNDSQYCIPVCVLHIYWEKSIKVAMRNRIFSLNVVSDWHFIEQAQKYPGWHLWGLAYLTLPSPTHPQIKLNIKTQHRDTTQMFFWSFCYRPSPFLTNSFLPMKLVQYSARIWKLLFSARMGLKKNIIVSVTKSEQHLWY